MHYLILMQVFDILNVVLLSKKKLELQYGEKKIVAHSLWTVPIHKPSVINTSIRKYRTILFFN